MSEPAQRLRARRAAPESNTRTRVIVGLAAVCAGFALLAFAVETLSLLGVPDTILAWVMPLFAILLPAVVALPARTVSLLTFSVAGRQLGVPENTMAGTVSLFGSVFAMGLAAALARSEAETSALAVGLCSGMLLSGILIAPYLRRSAMTAIGDLLAARFGGRWMSGLTGLAVLAAATPMLVAELSLVSAIAQDALGVGARLAVIVAAVLMLLPPLLGGMRGLTVAGVVQFLLAMVSFATASIWLSQSVAGHAFPLFGYGAAMAGEAAAMTISQPPARDALQLAVCVALGIAAFPALLVRSSAVQSSDAVRWSLAWQLLFVALLCVACVSMSAMALGVAAAANADLILLAVAEAAGAPSFIGMVIVAGCLAMAVAAGSLLLFIIGRAFGHSIAFRFLLPRLPASRRLLVQRLAIVLAAGLAAHAALAPPAAYLSLALIGLSLAASGLLPILLLAIWWRRANHAGALIGMFVGFASACYVTAADLYDPRLYTWLEPVGLKELAMRLGGEQVSLVSAPLGVVVAVLVSLLTRTPGDQRRAFAQSLFSPRDTVADDLD